MVITTSSSSSKEATRFSAACAKCSMLGSSSFLLMPSFVRCSGEAGTPGSEDTGERPDGSETVAGGFLGGSTWGAQDCLLDELLLDGEGEGGGGEENIAEGREVGEELLGELGVLGEGDIGEAASEDSATLLSTPVCVP